METRDVKLRIELDATTAAASSDGLGATPGPVNPGAPATPGAPTPDAGAGAGAGDAPTTPGAAQPQGEGAPAAPGRGGSSEAEIERRVEASVLDKITGTGSRLARAAKGGSLSGEALALIGTVPVAGTAARGLSLVERYGPMAAAAVDELAPDAAKPATSMALGATEEAARKFGRARATLDSFGAAYDRAVELAANDRIVAGAVDPAFIAEYGRRSYLEAAEMAEIERNRRILGSEAAGAGMAATLRGALSAGLGAAVGK